MLTTFQVQEVSLEPHYRCQPEPGDLGVEPRNTIKYVHEKAGVPLEADSPTCFLLAAGTNRGTMSRRN